MSWESKNTASMCHTFEIAGYRHTKGFGVGRFIRSTTITVGGFDWSIRFYPNGVSEATKDCVIVLLELMGSNTEAQACYVLRFVNQEAPQMMQVLLVPMQAPQMAGSAQGTGLFKSCDDTRLGVQNPLCMLRDLLDLPRNLNCYIVNDCLKIQCDLTVVRKSRLSGNGAVYVNNVIDMLPCDMMQHFGNLLREKKGVDVTFLVGGETIEAHKIVLAARSPVFKAEFFGTMMESGTSRVTVEDMQPEVFRALLHFIYNDLLPDMGGLDGNDYRDMMWHLLAAADRYAMDRMKLVCQSTICKNLDVGTVATTLALADQYNCDRLKTACIEFIASPMNKDAVAATQGYANLKRTCPSVFIDLFERNSKISKHT
ncbi:unnamed protein product [Urochloa decumbens]|uniref:Uncharacterized protein n=1 Tax=Urochloa decumbens TaxID=240449 RepID=A0ABC9BYQ7_9POAL